MHLIKASNIGVYYSKSNNTATNPRSKCCGTNFQGPRQELVSKGKATAKLKEQLEEIKDKLGAKRAGMYIIMVWNEILDKLMGSHPTRALMMLI